MEKQPREKITGEPLEKPEESLAIAPEIPREARETEREEVEEIEAIREELETAPSEGEQEREVPQKASLTNQSDSKIENSISQLGKDPSSESAFELEQGISQEK